MHSTSRVAYSSEESFDVKIDSLYLEGASGKVVASIDERMVSLEAKSGHGLDIKIHTINRVQHHHTRLVPAYVATLGLAMVWSAIRIFATGPIQMIMVIGGLGLILGWAVTRKPTLTIDTEAGDCHVITGNDFSLLKLNTILLKLQKGFSLQEASDGLEILESDALYPRGAILETNVVPVEIATVTRPDSIATFLSSDVAESMASEPEPLPAMDLSIFDNQMPPIEAPEITTPSWQAMAVEKRERFSTTSHPLIERGINNVGDRRGRQDSHPMSMFDKIDFDLPTSVVTPSPQQSQPPTPPSSGLLSHVNSHPQDEAGPAKMPDLLPSFWSRDGYHNPNEPHQEEIAQTDFSGFNSPDTLLGGVDYDGNEIESLVATARKAHNLNIQQPTTEGTTSQNSRLRKRTASNNSRLVKRRNSTNRNHQRRGRLVPSIGNAVRDFGSSITNRIMHTLEESSNQTSNLRERADEAQQDELETFRNLAESNGGPIPDEKARQLEANVKRRKALIEQNQQEFADSSDELSFTDLVDSETHKSSTAGKGGIPRIDL
ncbi:MAG: MerC domain-containing protein [Candidatus Thermoplasmatota archaeon]|nr:MerC domain-containing protein [Candidatus Thermoplasmatota archaeon]